VPDALGLADTEGVSVTELEPEELREYDWLPDVVRLGVPDTEREPEALALPLELGVVVRDAVADCDCEAVSDCVCDCDGDTLEDCVREGD